MDEATLNFLLGAGLVLSLFIALYLMAYLERPRIKAHRVKEVEIWSYDEKLIKIKSDGDKISLIFAKRDFFIGVDLSRGEFEKFKEALLSFDDSPQKST